MTARYFLIFSIGFYLGIGFTAFFLSGCASTPTKAFNAEDKQDGPCYATLGGGIGYCNSTRGVKQ